MLWGRLALQHACCCDSGCLSGVACTCSIPIACSFVSPSCSDCSLEACTCQWRAVAVFLVSHMVEASPRSDYLRLAAWGL